MGNLYKRILVTGGCGFVGREVVKILLQKDYDIVVADDLSNPQSRVEPGYRFVRADIGDPQRAVEAFDGVDACIALASRRGAIGYVYRNPTEILLHNNRIYSATFSAAVRARVKRLIFISSSMVYESSKDFPWKEECLRSLPIPISTFGFSKLIGEWHCHAFRREHSLSFTIIRPSNIYGYGELPGQEVGDTHVIPELFQKVSSGRDSVEILGNGKQTRCFVHVNDLVRGIVMSLEDERAENEDFNMGGLEEIQMLELAQMIWALCERQEKFKASFVAGFPQDVQRQFLDSSKARTLLNWEPKVSFRNGLREVVDWLRGHAKVTC